MPTPSLKLPARNAAAWLSFLKTTQPVNAVNAVTASSIQRWISDARPTATLPSSASGDLPPELVAQKEDLLKDRVAIAVKRYLKSDFKRIGRAARRARHAEQICQGEKGNLAAVLIAAYLWDLADQEADAGKFSAARTLLADLKAPDPLVDKVIGLIGHTQDSNGNGFGDHQVAGDAAAIVAMEDRVKENAGRHSDIERFIEEEVKTQTGKRYARDLFLSQK